MLTHTLADDKFVQTLTEETAGNSIYFPLSVVSAVRKPPGTYSVACWRRQ